MREVGNASRPRSIPAPASTESIELDYARRILRYVVMIERATEALRAELPALIARARAERQDAGEGKRAQELLRAAREALERLNTEELEALALEFGRRTETFQRVQMSRQVKAALGVDLFPPDGNLNTLLEGFAVENAELIRNIPEKLVQDIATTTTRAIQSGTLHTDLARELEKRFGFARKRARLIARDQVGKLYSNINKTRFRAIGVGRYIWRTSGDERVRETHVGFDGNTYTFKEGSPEGNPGEPILCRCFPEPIFDDILALV